MDYESKLSKIEAEIGVLDRIFLKLLDLADDRRIIHIFDKVSMEQEFSMALQGVKDVLLDSVQDIKDYEEDIKDKFANVIEFIDGYKELNHIKLSKETVINGMNCNPNYIEEMIMSHIEKIKDKIERIK